MKFILDMVLMMVFYAIARSIALYLNINVHMVLPWSWFMVMTIKTYRGDYEKITNKRLEVLKLFSLTSLMTASMWILEIYWV